MTEENDAARSRRFRRRQLKRITIYHAKLKRCMEQKKGKNKNE